MEVKNNHAYVTTQRILNKFIEINFSGGMYGLAVMMSISTPTTSKNIDKIPLGGTKDRNFFAFIAHVNEG